MEMSNLTAKLKSIKLEIVKDFRAFGFDLTSSTLWKDKWSINELISHYVQEEERLHSDKTKSVHRSQK
ncbi:hypothetical protein CR513_44595, partial [Mucuna pruriens]